MKLALATAAMFGLGMAHAASSDLAIEASRPGNEPSARPKSASAQSVASRAYVTPAQTLYGGFTLSSSATVYIIVRGNSLGTLGITSNYLDAPRVRLFDRANNDLSFDATGRAGFNACLSSGTFSAIVSSYYQSRNIPVNDRDACTSKSLAAGVYTFTVTPSIAGTTTTTGTSSPSSGEVLFEVTLGP